MALDTFKKYRSVYITGLISVIWTFIIVMACIYVIKYYGSSVAQFCNIHNDIGACLFFFGYMCLGIIISVPWFAMIFCLEDIKRADLKKTLDKPISIHLLIDD